MVPSCPPQDEPVALRSLLEAVARELALMVALGERTQADISPLLTDARVASLGTQGAQSLDVLVQQAAGLGEFVSTLGRSCPMEWAIAPYQAGERLRMQAQRRRLASPSAKADAPLGETGAVELF